MAALLLAGLALAPLHAQTTIISTVAGNGTAGYNGDGIAATSAEMEPVGVAVDKSGNLYIADSDWPLTPSNERVRMVTPAGEISTIAGTGTANYNGDGIPATTAELNSPNGVAVDSSGNIYIADEFNFRIRVVCQVLTFSCAGKTVGDIYTVAGNGTQGNSGDNGPATSAELNRPVGVAVDSSGNIYIADWYNNSVRMVTVAGHISTVAGNLNNSGYSGDGGPATSALLNKVGGVAVDTSGNIYIADTLNSAVRLVCEATTFLCTGKTVGDIYTVAGPGPLNTGQVGYPAAYLGDGGPATSAIVGSPEGVAVDSSGNIYIADASALIRMVNTAGVISTIAGNKAITNSCDAGGDECVTAGYSGDGGSPTSAQLNEPTGIALGTAGAYYIADLGNNRVREVAPLPAPTVTVTPSASSITTAEGLSVTITVSGASGTPTATGSVTLTSGTYTSAASALSGGSVRINIPSGALATGVDTLTAAYTPDTTSASIFSASSGNGQVTVVIVPAVTVTPTSFSITSAQALMVTVAVSGGSGNPTPTGTVILSSGSYNSAITSLSGGSTIITVPAGSLAAGSDTLAADYSPDSNSSSTYGTAMGTSSSVMVTQVQTITFTDSLPASATYSTGLSYTLSATGGASGQPVTFSITAGSGIANITNGNTLNITGTGLVTITANQAASGNYAAATPVTQSILINAIAQTISFTDSLPTSATYSTGLSYTLSATGGASGQPVTFSITVGSGIANITNGNTLNITGTGLVTITANQAASGNYAAAAPVTQSIQINPVPNPVPVISSLSPVFTSAGTAAFTLTVNGSLFTANSTVYWGASALSTTYGSATQLTAQVPASDITTAGISAITVQTPSPGGGTSNSWQFEVDSAASGTTTPPSFTTITASVAPGATASYPVTLPSTATNVSVTCLNLPTGSGCSYSASTGAVTITTSPTTPAGTYQITVVFTSTQPGAAPALILLPILLLPLAFLRRRLAARGVWFTACLGLVLLAGMVVVFVGCGGTAATHTATSSGSVSLTVT